MQHPTRPDSAVRSAPEPHQHNLESPSPPQVAPQGRTAIVRLFLTPRRGRLNTELHSVNHDPNKHTALTDARVSNLARQTSVGIKVRLPETVADKFASCPIAQASAEALLEAGIDAFIAGGRELQTVAALGRRHGSRIKKSPTIFLSPSLVAHYRRCARAAGGTLDTLASCALSAVFGA